MSSCGFFIIPTFELKWSWALGVESKRLQMNMDRILPYAQFEFAWMHCRAGGDVWERKRKTSLWTNITYAADRINSGMFTVTRLLHFWAFWMSTHKFTVLPIWIEIQRHETESNNRSVRPTIVNLVKVSRCAYLSSMSKIPAIQFPSVSLRSWMQTENHSHAAH